MAAAAAAAAIGGGGVGWAAAAAAAAAALLICERVVSAAAAAAAAGDDEDGGMMLRDGDAMAADGSVWYTRTVSVYSRRHCKQKRNHQRVSFLFVFPFPLSSTAHFCYMTVHFFEQHPDDLFSSRTTLSRMLSTPLMSFRRSRLSCDGAP